MKKLIALEAQKAKRTKKPEKAGAKNGKEESRRNGGKQQPDQESKASQTVAVSTVPRPPAARPEGNPAEPDGRGDLGGGEHPAGDGLYEDRRHPGHHGPLHAIAAADRLCRIRRLAVSGLVVSADSATAAILAVGVSPMAATGSTHYLALASTVALLAAGLLLLVRLLWLGFLADFLSRTVMIGFLTGVGFQVCIAVLGEMLGIPVKGNITVQQFWTVAEKFPLLHWPTLAVSAGVVAVIVVSRRFAPRLPGALLAVVAAIGLSAALDFAGHGIAVLGPVAGGLPQLGIPAVSWDEVYALLPIAGSCFVMIVAQSSVTARAYAIRHHQTLDENRDLLGLCAADTAAALSGTFVVNGSPTQTAMVETSGGNS